MSKKFSSNPQKYGVPHDQWRPAQFDAVSHVGDLHESGEQTHVFLEAPTGIGKSGIATAVGSLAPVTVLMGTLNLLDQYHDDYGFAIVKGRQNYPCSHGKKVERWSGKYSKTPTAADCHFSPMHNCPEAGSCEYISARSKAVGAKRTAVTYPFAFLSEAITKRKGILVLDECHEAVEQVIRFAEFEVGDSLRREWDFPQFPSELNDYGKGGKGAVLDAASSAEVSVWLRSCQKRIDEVIQWEDSLSENNSKAQRLFDRFQRVLETMGSTAWFLECGPKISQGRKGRNWVDVPGLKLRALSAKIVAGKLWSKKDLTVLMSATIGDAGPLASELGISNYDFQTFSHPVPTRSRPVIDLGVKRMTFANLTRNPSLYKIQSIQIAAWIKTLDKDWRGIVLAPSYKKIGELAKHLISLLPRRRFIVQKPGDKVFKVTEKFIRDRKPGDILIASIQGFGHGLDLRGDIARFCAVAGIPHTNPFDRFEQVRKKQNGKYGWWQAYCSVPQAAGRVSRGEQEDNGDWMLNVAALADGSAMTKLALRYYPDWFKEAIV